MKNLKINNDPLFKVTTRNCGDFRSLCDNRITMPDLQKIIDLHTKAIQYLSASGQTVGVDGGKIGYHNASYRYITLEEYKTITGEQIVAWQFRKRPSNTWEGLNFSTMNVLGRTIAENNMCAIGALKFENGQMKEEFMKDLRERVKPKDENEFKRDLETLKDAAKRHAVYLKKTNLKKSNDTFDSQLNTSTGWIIKIESMVSKTGNKIAFISPELTICPKEKRIKKSK